MTDPIHRLDLNKSQPLTMEDLLQLIHEEAGRYVNPRVIIGVLTRGRQRLEGEVNIPPRLLIHYAECGNLKQIMKAKTLTVLWIAENHVIRTAAAVVAVEGGSIMSHNCIHYGRKRPVDAD